jgi:threonine aldolase
LIAANKAMHAIRGAIWREASEAEWRRRESNPQVQSRNSQVAQRLWNMLQDVGVSWEWKDDANWQSVATEHEELAELITAWPLLSANLKQAILAIVRSLAVAEEAVSRTP